MILFLNLRMVAFLGRVMVFSLPSQETKMSNLPVAEISLNCLPLISSKNNSMELTHSYWFSLCKHFMTFIKHFIQFSHLVWKAK